jgi:hypothetical protein
MNSGPPFRLRDLGFGTRLGLTFLVLTILGGLAASLQHLVWHHQNRDEQPGVSMTDIQGAYHGVVQPAPLLTALERNHPPELAAKDRDLLLGWLRGTRINEDYDNLDLGDSAPNEIIARACVSCHARNATQGDGIGKTIPLEFYDDAKKVAFSKRINPTDVKILAASTHTHALALGSLTIVMSGMLLLTRWPRALVGLLILLAGGSLFADLGSWWLARGTAGFVYLIAAAGTAYAATMALAGLAVIADLWLPRRVS